MDKKLLIIGIDAPEGLAIWNPERQRFHDIVTTSFWNIIDNLAVLRSSSPHHKLRVYIEDPGFNKPTFFRKTGLRAMRKISQNVGQNKQCAKLIIEYCKRLEIGCVPLRPLRGPLKLWKKDRPGFEQMTGWAAPTSEHGRDAAALVWKRTK